MDCEYYLMDNFTALIVYGVVGALMSWIISSIIVSIKYKVPLFKTSYSSDTKPDWKLRGRIGCVTFLALLITEYIPDLIKGNPIKDVIPHMIIIIITAYVIAVIYERYNAGTKEVKKKLSSN